jgi:hypothetical protein
MSSVSRTEAELRGWAALSGDLATEASEPTSQPANVLPLHGLDKINSDRSRSFIASS